MRRAMTALGALVVLAGPAQALDKQGSAHGGSIEGLGQPIVAKNWP